MFFAVGQALFAAAIALTVGATAIGFSRVTGWRHYRVLGLTAVVVFWYSVAQVGLVWPGASDARIAVSGPMIVSLSYVYAACWVVYSAIYIGGEATRVDRVLFGCGIAAAAAVWIPGWAFAGIDSHYVGWLELEYRVPVMTPPGEAFAFGLLVLIGVPCARIVRQARRGLPGAATHAVGFGLFYGLGIADVIAYELELATPFLAPTGMLAVLLAAAVDMASRVARDAGSLVELNQLLEDRAEARGRELAQAREALLHAERLAALGQLAAGVGHEVNNPLTTIVFNAEYLRGDDRDPIEVREGIDDIAQAAERIRAIVADLSAFARRGDPAEPATADVGAAVAEAMRLVGPRLERIGSVERGVGDDLHAAVSPTRLSQVLVNLLVNAAQACEAGGSTIAIRAREAGGWIEIEVRDDGAGMAPETAQRVFEPYFTTKAVGDGTGLGLFVCKGIAEAAGGSIEVVTARGRGTAFTVRLPAACGVEPAARAGDGDGRLAGVRVVVVDDEPAVARAIGRALGPAQVKTFTEPERACAYLLSRDDYDLVISDVTMPRLSGVALYRALTRAKPGLASHFIFVTGGAVSPDARDMLDSGALCVLSKPIAGSMLRRQVLALARRAQ